MNDTLTDLAFAAGWGVLPRLPTGLTRRSFELAAAQIARRPGALAQLRLNLNQATGNHLEPAALGELTRRAFVSYLRYWHEAFRMPSTPIAEIIQRAQVSGTESIAAAQVEGRGVVVALTHSGNWDAAAVWVTHGPLAMPLTAVTERLQPESLYDRFRRYRESLGMHVVPLTGGAQPPAAVLKAHLHAGHMVVLLADRNLAGSGIEVPLCGRRTILPSGPALLATHTDALLITLEQYFTPHGWQLKFHPPIAVPSEGRLRAR
ncbi:MAG: phosphatidylinositol mannoside acyltransferase, partial [Antricoccus sp.]